MVFIFKRFFDEIHRPNSSLLTGMISERTVRQASLKGESANQAPAQSVGASPGWTAHGVNLRVDSAESKRLFVNHLQNTNPLLNHSLPRASWRVPGR